MTEGNSKTEVDEGKSPSKDRQQHVKHEAKHGEGDRGDEKR
jgi:hypothetical protein